MSSASALESFPTRLPTSITVPRELFPNLMALIFMSGPDSSRDIFPDARRTRPIAGSTIVAENN